MIWRQAFQQHYCWGWERARHLETDHQPLAQPMYNINNYSKVKINSIWSNTKLCKKNGTTMDTVETMWTTCITTPMIPINTPPDSSPSLSKNTLNSHLFNSVWTYMYTYMLLLSVSSKVNAVWIWVIGLFQLLLDFI